jgi:hypothetical protein
MKRGKIGEDLERVTFGSMFQPHSLTPQAPQGQEQGTQSRCPNRKLPEECNPHWVQERQGHVERAILTEACEPLLPHSLENFTLMGAVKAGKLVGEELAFTLSRVTTYLKGFFNRPNWLDILVEVVQSIPRAMATVAQTVVQQLEERFSPLFSLHIKMDAALPRRAWRRISRYVNCEGEHLPCGVRFPKVFTSWEKVWDLYKVFARQGGWEEHDRKQELQYRLFSNLLPSIFSCETLMSNVQASDEGKPTSSISTKDDGQEFIELDVLIGIDAVPVNAYATVLPRSLTHMSVSLMQYGRVAASSQWARHLLAVYAGKDTPDALKMNLDLCMVDLFSFQTGRIIPVQGRSLLVILHMHMTGDVVTLFALRRVSGMMGRCGAGPDPADTSNHDFLESEQFIWPFLPENIHPDLPLHFLTNWLARVLRGILSYPILSYPILFLALNPNPKSEP